MKTKTIAIILMALLSLALLPQVNASDIVITIKGGIGYKASVYNPGPDSINMTVSLIFIKTGQELVNDSIGCVPGGNTTLGRKVFGLARISITVIAEEQILTRNGLVLGPFVFLF